MADSRSDQPRQDRQNRGGDKPAKCRPKAVRWGRVLLAPAIFGITALAGAELVRVYPTSVAIPWMGLIMLVLAGSAFATITLHRHLEDWRWPLRQLEQTLEEVRSGQATIDQLGSIPGPLHGLVEQVQEMARQNRRLRAQLAQNDMEMSQRVAQRTNALERVIGALRLAANRDSLTGLYNRRMFDQHLDAVVDQAMADGADLCLIMLDLDNFKSLNDTVGHAAGDEFLRSVGQLINSTIRQEDYGFRCGGDEFVVVMPGAGKVAGQKLATRLMSLVDGLGKTSKSSKPLGMSAGLATLWELPEPQLACLKDLADKRLYAVKAARKDTTTPAASRRDVA